MFNQPPPFKQHWVYDDPSGVAEPVAYARPWRPRQLVGDPRRTPRTANRRAVRLTHREA